MITINDFSGISPSTPPRYLANGQAQIAFNCFTWRGPLRPIKGTEFLQDLPKVGGHTSIYRFGQEVTGEDQFWLHWSADVDVVKGFISGDTSERTFFSGDGPPRVTDNTLALTSNNGRYPSNSYLLGVPSPTDTPTCTVVGTEEEGATTEDRVYTYTYVNSWSEESVPYTEEPYPLVAQCTVSTGQHVNLDIPAPSLTFGNYNITSKRIYRSATGSAATIFQFVAEIPVSQVSYVDLIEAEELVEELPSLYWDHPPADLKGFVALPNGVIAGFSGIDVYLSEPFRPFAWPTDYSDAVSDKIVGLGAIDTTVVVLTEGTPKFWQGSSPGGFVMVDSDLTQACVSKRSIVSMDGMVYYASPDGLCAVSPGGSNIVTQSLFEKEQWQELNPASMHGYIYDGRYIGFYDNGVTQGGFVFDRVRGSFTLHDIYATGGYTDLRNDSLYLIINNDLYKWDTGDTLNYIWKSKVFTHPREIGYTCYQLDAEAYPMTMRVYRDGSLHYELSVPDNRVRRLPPGTGRDWEVEIEGAHEVFGIKIAQSPSEIAGA